VICCWVGHGACVEAARASKQGIPASLITMEQAIRVPCCRVWRRRRWQRDGGRRLGGASVVRRASRTKKLVGAMRRRRKKGSVIAPGLRPRRHDRRRTSGGARRRGLTALQSMANEPVAASHHIDGRPTFMDILAADVVLQSRHGGVFNARPAATSSRCTPFLENKGRIAGKPARHTWPVVRSQQKAYRPWHRISG
jgi:hypothetical protein